MKEYEDDFIVERTMIVEGKQVARIYFDKDNFVQTDIVGTVKDTFIKLRKNLEEASYSLKPGSTKFEIEDESL